MSTACLRTFFNSKQLVCRGFQLHFQGAMSELVGIPCGGIALNNMKDMQSGDSTQAKRPRIEVDRVKRKKVAILLAYSGQGYFGMQRNPETKTIEEDLLSALMKAGYISEEGFTTPQTIQFQRAARTDKGVSAARQIVSLKLPEESNVEKINEHLPDQIRSFAIIRTTKGFNCKSSCDARTYSYMLPTFAFTPFEEKISTSYKITTEVLANVNSTLKLFEGTHNFHNFTSKKKPGDPSANRYIMSFECGAPFLKGDVEFIVIKVKGQSFMLHQIRKMIGLAVAVVKGLADTETITKAWNADRLDIPVAPGLGLVLDEVHYDRYNQRYGRDGIHELLSWEAFESDVNSFKDQFIYPTIVETETKEESMLNWLLTLPLHTYDIREEREASVAVEPQSECARENVTTSSNHSESVERSVQQKEDVNGSDSAVLSVFSEASTQSSGANL